MMPNAEYDFDRYIKLVEAYRSVREAAMESAKTERSIRKEAKEDERLELDRKKKFINDLIEIGKFLIKLCSTGLLAALALSSTGFFKEVLLYVCIGGILFGGVLLFGGLKFRSDIEEDFISEHKKMAMSYDESLGPLVDYAEAIKDEVAILNEMVQLEQKTMIEKYPEMKQVILGGIEK